MLVFWDFGTLGDFSWLLFLLFACTIKLVT
jgi:hypothetical protein